MFFSSVSPHPGYKKGISKLSRKPDVILSVGGGGGEGNPTNSVQEVLQVISVTCSFAKLLFKSNVFFGLHHKSPYNAA